MNINTGGPHVLLFERDQQVTALVTSELQLAGYECHAARTAVEVFDAIARYPVRLILVNLAQAAAGRREFWVALDTQRRGRGVQVLTFRCSNLAVYGPQDPEERSQTMMGELEIDGMLGIVNLVAAVRSRLPISTGTTGSFRPISSSAGDRARMPPSVSNVPEPTSRQAPMPHLAPATQVTAPFPAIPPMTTAMPPTPLNAVPPRPQPPFSPAPTGNPPPSPTPPSNHGTGGMEPARSAAVPSTFTDKIRAVIYPSSRNFSPVPENANSETTLRATVTTSPSARQPSADTATLPPPPASAALPQNSAPPYPYGQRDESSLAQLSRMLHERDEVLFEQLTQEAEPLPLPQANTNFVANNSAVVQSAELPLRQMPLRASPIEDLPPEVGINNGMMANQSTRPDYRLERSDTSIPIGMGQQQTVSILSPLASMSAPLASPPNPTAPLASPPNPTATPTPKREESGDSSRRKPPSAPSLVPVSPTREESFAIAQESGSGLRPAPLAETTITEMTDVRNIEEEHGLPPVSVARPQQRLATDQAQALLLDIVQSLPPMPPTSSPPPQMPSLSGRATRSLENVLLEGHLVPQDRLEVAHTIQRMLRGVDMNYQLGEILLMFKLLTPDQLLAASLVSYGLISALQIRALGRIRQELHSIGLEYDLENLLILFRILKPEQLREIRSSWSG